MIASWTDIKVIMIGQRIRNVLNIIVGPLNWLSKNMTSQFNDNCPRPVFQKVFKYTLILCTENFLSDEKF